MQRKQQIQELLSRWTNDPRWKGVTRPYLAEAVVRLRGSIRVEHTLARLGAEKLWRMLHELPYVHALGAITGNQAVEMVHAGLKAVYVSGWQIAGDNNNAGQMYPDQSLYPMDSGPRLVRAINNALQRADQVAHLDNELDPTDYFVPLFCDAEAGFGGPLNTFELIKAYIEAGAAAIHLEDQVSSLKKCGHMGGKVLVPDREMIEKLKAARLAADVLDVPTLIVARTDAEDASLIRSDFDEIDRPFLTGERTADGFYRIRGGVPYAIARARAYAPYADVLWCETSKPDLGEAREFAQGVHEKFPGKMLAYNCSPSFNWRKYLDEQQMLEFQQKIGAMGYKFQFVTLAGFHALNASMFDLAHGYRDRGMAAYSELQEHEFAMEREHGYQAVKHQRFVGVGYFDEVTLTLSGGEASSLALRGSTEEDQFHPAADRQVRERVAPGRLARSSTRGGNGAKPNGEQTAGGKSKRAAAR